MLNRSTMAEVEEDMRKVLSAEEGALREEREEEVRPITMEENSRMQCSSSLVPYSSIRYPHPKFFNSRIFSFIVGRGSNPKGRLLLT